MSACRRPYNIVLITDFIGHKARPSVGSWVFYYCPRSCGVSPLHRGRDELVATFQKKLSAHSGQHRLYVCRDAGDPCLRGSVN
jgi:hypothetical protein